MGRIGEALSKLSLNSNVTHTPYKDMKPKEIVDLCYHLAEVYDAEALLPETGVKKKLKVFKNFARVHSLIHLVPPVKEMKPKKCIRLVTSLLDTLEEKWGDVLYTRTSWPVACKELPKIEVTVSGGGYNLENVNLDPNAVPPGALKRDNFPRTRKAEIVSTSNQDKVYESAGNLSTKTNTDNKPNESVITSSTKPIIMDSTTNPITVAGDYTKTSPSTEGEYEIKNSSLGDLKNINSPKLKDEVGDHEQVSNSSSNTVKRPLEKSLPAQGSNETLKKLKTEHSACEQFIKALEELAKVRSVVEVVGWDKVLFTNQRIWKAIQNVVFSRVLLGKKLRKYQAKKVVPGKQAATTCGVTVEKKISDEDMKVLNVKLVKLMEQISNAVPDNLLEDMKCAVKTSCRNVTLNIRESDDFL